MCGITGIALLNGGSPRSDVLDKMNNTLVHRGPDGDGMCISGGVGLAMRRLAIIDIDGGWQPIYNEDKSVALVFNGEIYNFRELRRELEKQGHRFYSDSDSEVIAHAYEEFGLDFPKHLDGMFAVALHDRARKLLVLTRDHFGIKPLYYSVGKDWLVWGSEPKAILASGLIEPTLDLDALGEFFDWEYVPAPRTLFKEIRKLPAAHTLTLDLSQTVARPELGRFWDVPVPEQAIALPEDEWIIEAEKAITSSTRAQLVSDVPLGAFLSGGVDSSLIVYGMGDANTYSIGFSDPSYNELEYSRKVANHLGISHTTRIIEPNVRDLFPFLMQYMDDPIGDFSIFPTYMVSELAREHVTVALAGDGGDELFGGYETYVAAKLGARFDWLPARIRRLISRSSSLLPPTELKKGFINKVKRFSEGLEHNPSLAHTRWRLFVGERMRQALFNEDARAAMTLGVGSHIDMLFANAGARNALDRQLYVDTYSYLTDNCLVKTDRMSMATSLEARVPFLSKGVAEFAFSVPPHLKLHGSRTKVLLKALAARHLPRSCVYRPKEGFSIPIKSWLKSELRPMLEQATTASALQQSGVFEPGTIARLKNEHLSGQANHSHILWSIIVFHDWQERWLRQAANNLHHTRTGDIADVTA